MLRVSAVLALASSQAAAQFEYEQDGSFRVVEQPTTSAKLIGSGCDDTRGVCDVRINTMIPDDGETETFPLVVLSNGFMLPDAQYASYARRLASWGYIALRWTPAVENALVYPRHRQRGAMVNELITWAEAEYGSRVDTRRVMVMGHSAGGKSSTLAAADDERIVGLLGIDPVDCPPPFQQIGPDFPTSALLLPRVTAKSIWVGAEYGPDPDPFGQACGPGECNFPWFYGNATSAWQVEMLGTGHMQFLDNRAAELPALFCKAGGDDMDRVAGDVTKVLSVALAEHTIRGADISRYTGEWIQQQVGRGVVRSDIKNWATEVVEVAQE